MLGGVLTGLLGWRSVFLVNVPLCLAGAALGAHVLRESRDASAGRPDAAGAALVTATLAAVLLAFTFAASDGPVGDGHAGGGRRRRRAGGAARARGVARARSAARPRAAAPAGVAQANLVALALTATTTPPMWLCILHAQDVLGLEPATAGLLFPPFNVAVVAGSLAGPRVVAAVGARRAMAGGLLGVAAGALALLAIAPDAPPLPTLVGGFVLLGAGLGVASVASTLRGTEALDAADQGFASGLLATSAQLGTAFGLALIVPFTAARAAAGGGDAAAQVAGYELGFMLAAAVAGAAALAVAFVQPVGRGRGRGAGVRGAQRGPLAPAPAARMAGIEGKRDCRWRRMSRALQRNTPMAS